MPNPWIRFASVALLAALPFGVLAQPASRTGPEARKYVLPRSSSIRWRVSRRPPCG